MSEYPGTPPPLPPHSAEAERYLLSAVLLDGAPIVARAQAAGLMPLAFHVTTHRESYALILDMHAAQKPIDVATFAEELRTNGRLEAIGGWAFVTALSASLATTAQAEYFIGKVLELWQLRRIIDRATTIVESCYGYDGDMTAIGGQISRLGTVLTGTVIPRSWPQAVAEAEEVTRERMKPPADRKVSVEMSWGIPAFDRFFRPIEAGELIVIGGYTSSGKSSLLRQILWGLVKMGYSTLLHTLEVRDTEEAINLAGHVSGFNPRFDLDRLHTKDQEEILAAYKTMTPGHFSVSHQDPDLRAMVARATAFRAKVGTLRAMGVDYLQLMADVDRCRPTDRPNVIASITGELKRFATAEGCAVFLLSGLNRGFFVGEREPRMGDLEGSSAIEKNANRVLLIDVPNEYSLGGVSYEQSTTGENPPERLFARIIQAKGRNQGTGSLGMFFKRSIKTFQPIQL